MGRPERELECPARSTYTSGQRGETNKTLENAGEGATTAKIFGAAMELPSTELPTNGSESIRTSMAWAIWFLCTYNILQSNLCVSFLMWIVRARVGARVAPFCVTMGPTDARTPFFQFLSFSLFLPPPTHSLAQSFASIKR